MRFLRIRKVRPNDANGMCRRETIPANPAFPEGDCSNKWTLALCVPIKRTTHMYGRFIAMVKGLFLLGMLDPTPLIGDASVLRRLVVQILRSELRARCVGTGTRLYEQIRTMCSQGVCTVRLVIRAPPANSQKHQVLFVTRHNPSDPPQWVFNGSLFSCFISILTLTHLLICMLHRKRGSFCRERSHHKVHGKLCLAGFSLVDSAHPLTFYIPFSFPSRSNGLIFNQETVLGTHGVIMMGLCHKG